MVVRFDLERDGKAVTDRDHARILARSLQHVRRVGRQRLQHRARMLVRAVLAPERTHDTELGERGLAAEHLSQTLKLVARETVLGNKRWSDSRIAGTRLCGHATSSGTESENAVRAWLMRTPPPAWTRTAAAHPRSRAAARPRAPDAASTRARSRLH